MVVVEQRLAIAIRDLHIAFEGIADRERPVGLEPAVVARETVAAQQRVRESRVRIREPRVARAQVVADEKSSCSNPNCAYARFQLRDSGRLSPLD